MRLQIYKPGQGYYTRLLSALGGGAVVLAGCWRLYEKLSGLGISQEKVLIVQTTVPVVVFAILGFLLYWLVNRPSVADFMIAAEAEVKKVSWSSRKEVSVSTFIVIVVVVGMAALLAITDVFFHSVFMFIHLLPD
jgi:preprotein translocase subunit SecE